MNPKKKKTLPKYKKESVNTGKLANIFRILLFIPLKSSKKFLVKSKFYKVKGKTSEKLKNALKECSYAQMSKSNIKKIMKIKKKILNLLAKKIEEVHKVLNKSKKNKSKLNITTKSLLRKQVIIPISSNNSQKFMSLSNKHVFNINRTLKDIKSDVVADFIHTNNKRLTITTNKVASALDLTTIKKYIKNINNIDLEVIMLLRLP